MTCDEWIVSFSYWHKHTGEGGRGALQCASCFLHIVQCLLQLSPEPALFGLDVRAHVYNWFILTPRARVTHFTAIFKTCQERIKADNRPSAISEKSKMPSCQSFNWVLIALCVFPRQDVGMTVIISLLNKGDASQVSPRTESKKWMLTSRRLCAKNTFKHTNGCSLKSTDQ